MGKEASNGPPPLSPEERPKCPPPPSNGYNPPPVWNVQKPKPSPQAPQSLTSINIPVTGIGYCNIKFRDIAKRSGLDISDQEIVGFFKHRENLRENMPSHYENINDAYHIELGISIEKERRAKEMLSVPEDKIAYPQQEKHCFFCGAEMGIKSEKSNT